MTFLPHFVAALLLLTTVLAKPSPTVVKSCSQSCTGVTDKFNYPAGKTFIYKYEGSSQSLIKGLAKDHSSIVIKADVHLQSLKNCEMAMMLKNVEMHHSKPTNFEDLFKSDYSTEFATALEKSPLYFSYQDGYIPQTCPSKTDDETSLNVKKGILSVISNRMSNLYSDDFVDEADIEGSCMTNYYITKDDGSETTIRKEKSLDSCRDRMTSISSLQAKKYRLPSPYQSPPMTRSKYLCEQTIDSEKKQIKSVSCEETQLLSPFSKGSSGATIISKLKLTLSKVEDTSSPAPRPKLVKGNGLELTYESEQRKSPHDLAKVEKILEKLCDATKDSFHDQLPKEFSDLVDSLRNIKYPQLKKIHDNLLKNREKCPVPAKMFHDALPLLNTGCSVSLISDIILNGHVTGLERKYMLIQLAYSVQPTTDMLKGLKKLVEKSSDRTVLLTASGLVNNYCHRKGVKACSPSSEMATVTRKILLSHFKTCEVSETSADFDKTLSVIKAIGNIGYMFEDWAPLKECAKNKNVPTEIRIAAMDALRKMSCNYVNDMTRSHLIKILENASEDSEIRIRAYLGIMQCPASQYMTAIRELFEQGSTSNQVLTFIFTHLNSIRESDNPHQIELRKIIAENFEPIFVKNRYQSKKIDSWRFSSTSERSKFNSYMNTGMKIRNNLIYSEKSYLPRSFSTKMSMDLFGKSVDFVEFEGRLVGVEPYFEKMFMSKRGSKSKMRSLLKNKLGLNLGSKSKSTYKKTFFDRFLKSKRDNFKTVQEKLSATLFIRVLGSDVGYLGWRDLMSLYQKYAGQRLDLAKLNEVIGSLGKSWPVQYSKNMRLIDSRFVNPSLLGFPMVIQLQSTASMMVTVGGKVNAKNLKDLSLDMQLKPSGYLSHDGRMFLDYGQGKSGLQFLESFSASLPMNLQVTHKQGTKSEIYVKWPQDGKQQLVHFRRDFYVFDQSKSRIYTNTIPLKTGEKCKALGTGVKLCHSYSIPDTSKTPNAPYGPMAGSMWYKVYMDKPANHKGWKATIEFDGKVARKYTLEVPGDSERKIVYEVKLVRSKPDRVYDIKFTSPWQTVNTRATAKLNKSERRILEVEGTGMLEGKLKWDSAKTNNYRKASLKVFKKDNTLVLEAQASGRKQGGKLEAKISLNVVEKGNLSAVLIGERNPGVVKLDFTLKAKKKGEEKEKMLRLIGAFSNRKSQYGYYDKELTLSGENTFTEPPKKATLSIRAMKAKKVLVESNEVEYSGVYHFKVQADRIAQGESGMEYTYSFKKPLRYAQWYKFMEYRSLARVYCEPGKFSVGGQSHIKVDVKQKVLFKWTTSVKRTRSGVTRTFYEHDIEAGILDETKLEAKGNFTVNDKTGNVIKVTAGRKQRIGNIELTVSSESEAPAWMLMPWRFTLKPRITSSKNFSITGEAKLGKSQKHDLTLAHVSDIGQKKVSITNQLTINCKMGSKVSKMKVISKINAEKKADGYPKIDYDMSVETPYSPKLAVKYNLDAGKEKAGDVFDITYGSKKLFGVKSNMTKTTTGGKSKVDLSINAETAIKNWEKLSFEYIHNYSPMEKMGKREFMKSFVYSPWDAKMTLKKNDWFRKSTYDFKNLFLDAKWEGTDFKTPTTLKFGKAADKTEVVLNTNAFNYDTKVSGEILQTGDIQFSLNWDCKNKEKCPWKFVVLRTGSAATGNQLTVTIDTPWNKPKNMVFFITKEKNLPKVTLTVDGKKFESVVNFKQTGETLTGSVILTTPFEKIKSIGLELKKEKTGETKKLTGKFWVGEKEVTLEATGQFQPCVGSKSAYCANKLILNSKVTLPFNRFKSAALNIGYSKKSLSYYLYQFEVGVNDRFLGFTAKKQPKDIKFELRMPFRNFEKNSFSYKKVDKVGTANIDLELYCTFNGELEYKEFPNSNKKNPQSLKLKVRSSLMKKFEDAGLSIKFLGSSIEIKFGLNHAKNGDLSYKVIIADYKSAGMGKPILITITSPHNGLKEVRITFRRDTLKVLKISRLGQPVISFAVGKPAVPGLTKGFVIETAIHQPITFAFKSYYAQVDKYTRDFEFSLFTPNYYSKKKDRVGFNFTSSMQKSENNIITLKHKLTASSEKSLIYKLVATFNPQGNQFDVRVGTLVKAIRAYGAFVKTGEKKFNINVKSCWANKYNQLEAECEKKNWFKYDTKVEAGDYTIFETDITSGLFPKGIKIQSYKKFGFRVKEGKQLRKVDISGWIKAGGKTFKAHYLRAETELKNSGYNKTIEFGLNFAPFDALLTAHVASDEGRNTAGLQIYRKDSQGNRQVAYWLVNVNSDQSSLFSQISLPKYAGTNGFTMNHYFSRSQNTISFVREWNSERVIGEMKLTKDKQHQHLLMTCSKWPKAELHLAADRLVPDMREFTMKVYRVGDSPSEDVTFQQTLNTTTLLHTRLYINRESAESAYVKMAAHLREIRDQVRACRYAYMKDLKALSMKAVQDNEALVKGSQVMMKRLKPLIASSITKLSMEIRMLLKKNEFWSHHFINNAEKTFKFVKESMQKMKTKWNEFKAKRKAEMEKIGGPKFVQFWQKNAEDQKAMFKELSEKYMPRVKKMLKEVKEQVKAQMKKLPYGDKLSSRLDSAAKWYSNSVSDKDLEVWVMDQKTRFQVAIRSKGIKVVGKIIRRLTGRDIPQLNSYTTYYNPQQLEIQTDTYYSRPVANIQQAWRVRQARYQARLRYQSEKKSNFRVNPYWLKSHSKVDGSSFIPYPAHASLSNNHIVTFDHRFYAFKPYPCSFLLAGDMVSNKFSVFADYNSQGLRAVGIKTGENYHEITNKPMKVYVNNKLIPMSKMPYSVGSVTVRHENMECIIEDLSQGLKLTHFGSNIYDLVISGKHFGKVNGLFGTFNQHRSGPMPTPSEWQGRDSCSAKDTTVKPYGPQEENSQCDSLFSDWYWSDFSSCFRAVTPDPFKKSCMIRAASDGVDAQEAVCETSKWYINRCKRHNVLLSLPRECRGPMPPMGYGSI